MSDELGLGSDLLAAGTSCPMPDCGALSVTYRPECWDAQSAPEPFEFTCPRCGVEFIAFSDELLFRAVRIEWLQAGIYSA
jgi:hypothetical protein